MKLRFERKLRYKRDEKWEREAVEHLIRCAAPKQFELEMARLKTECTQLHMLYASLLPVGDDDSSHEWIH